MKKNFLKKLAAGLALAMVVTSVAPAATASAATSQISGAPSTVYVTKAYKLKLGKNVKATWRSKDKSVATVGLTGGVLKPVAPGKVQITSKSKVTGKTYKKNFTVKQRATEVDLGDDLALNVGETAELKAKLTPETSTDVIRYHSDNKAVANVGMTGGKVTANKNGEATITVYSKATTASSNQSAYTKTDEIKVRVGQQVLEAKAVATNKVEFDLAQKFVGKTTDINVVNTDSKLRIPVRSFELENDGKKVIATLDSSFVSGKTYAVTVEDSTKEFPVTIGKIAAIRIEDQIIKANTPSEIAYTVTDENGLDLTADYPMSKLTPVFSTGGLVDGKLTLGDKMSTFVTLKYVQFDTTGKDITVVSNQAKITGATANVSSITNWTIASKASKVDYTKPVQTISAENYNNRLFLKYINNLGKEEETNKVGSAGLTFTSLDSSVLVVDKNSGQLYPQKQGVAEVKIEAANTVVGYITVTVTEKAKLSSLVPDTTNVVLSKTGLISDTKDVTVKFKDQAGADFTATGTFKVSTIAGDKDIVNVTNITTEKDNATFTLTPFKKGKATLKVEIDGISTVIQVEVVEPGAVAQYVIETNKNEVDPMKDTLNFSVYSADASGAKVDIVTSGSLADGKWEVLDANNKVVKVPGTTDDYKDQALATDGKQTVTLSSASSELKDGTYTIKVTLGTYVVQKQFTVKTTRDAAVLNVKAYSTKVASGSALEVALNDLLNVKVKDEEKNITAVSYISNNSEILDSIGNANGVSTTTLKAGQTGELKLTITKVFYNDGAFTYEIPVNQEFTITVE